MPIKEYKCTGCDKVFEVLILNKSEEKYLICPKCGGRKLLSLFSAFSLHGTTAKVSNTSSCSGCSSKTCSTCK